MVNGGGGEDISNVTRLLSEPGTARVMLVQARPALSDRNGREKVASGAKSTESEELENARLRRINAGQANTIAQLRKTQDQVAAASGMEGPEEDARRADCPGNSRTENEGVCAGGASSNQATAVTSKQGPRIYA